jgi:hypothetical protein
VPRIFIPAWNLKPGRKRAFRRRCKTILFAALLSSGCGAPFSAFAQQGKPGEYQVKAVYLFNFGKFIEWPPDPAKRESFDICVLGRDPFGAALDSTLAGEKIGSLKPVARRISSVREAASCAILYVSSSENARVKQILDSVENRGVLTVSDLPGFTNDGGIIQFVFQDNKVRFEVNLAAAEKAGLTFSSQLLKVATAVKQNPAGENRKQ